MNIVCIGEALIDMICTDKGVPLRDGQHFLKKTGGAPTNVAAAIGALGGPVSLLAKVGNDAFGQALIEAMESFGVSVQWMLKDEKLFTTFAYVSLMEDGERDFVFNRGADGALSAAEIDQFPMDDVSIVHFGSATAFLPGPLQQAYLSLLQKAQQQNCFISFDPNYRHLLFARQQHSFIEQSWYYLKACHFFKLSDEEALLVTGADNLETAVAILLEKTSAVFTITLGRQGTLLGFRQKSYHIPSIMVNVVDSTGAGDAFVGAVLYQLNQKKNLLQLSDAAWQTIVSNANRAGARTCEYMGAMEAFKHLKASIFDEN